MSTKSKSNLFEKNRDYTIIKNVTDTELLSNYINKNKKVFCGTIIILSYF